MAASYQLLIILYFKIVFKTLDKFCLVIYFSLLLHVVVRLFLLHGCFPLHKAAGWLLIQLLISFSILEVDTIIKIQA